MVRDRLANEVHLSRSQVGRLFVEAFGKSPIAYLTMLRTERMAALLRTTDTPIAKIAQEVGWSDPDFAARQFRRSVGIAPSRHRALSRAGPHKRPGETRIHPGDCRGIDVHRLDCPFQSGSPVETRRTHRGAWRSPVSSSLVFLILPAYLAVTRSLPLGAALAEEVRRWLRTRTSRQGKIWSLDRDADGWRPYNGAGIHDPGNVTGGHFDHLHITSKPAVRDGSVPRL